MITGTLNRHDGFIKYPISLITWSINQQIRSNWMLRTCRYKTSCLITQDSGVQDSLCAKTSLFDRSDDVWTNLSICTILFSLATIISSCSWSHKQLKSITNLCQSSLFVHFTFFAVSFNHSVVVNIMFLHFFFSELFQKERKKSKVAYYT